MTKSALGHALITGASSGIGSTLARRLAARGYEVHLAARRREVLEQSCEQIRALGGSARVFELDVSRPEEAHERVARRDAEVGGFELVVANAGIGGKSAPAARLDFADVRAVMETNLMGAIATLLPVIPGMVARKRGHLVGVSSLAAEIPLPSAVDYGTSKAAFSFFLESSAADLAPRGIDVTIVHPGFVRTPLTDKNDFEMPFMVELEDAARIIDEGIARKRRFVRFPFQLAWAIGAGRTLPRGVRDALVARTVPEHLKT